MIAASKRILVVDDETSITSLLEEVLTRAGYAVDTAGDAARALALVREHRYDAAILDFNLPDMDGLILHHRLRQVDEALGRATLFISGLSQSGENLGYYDRFGLGFLAKPFEPRSVLEALGRVCER